MSTGHCCTQAPHVTHDHSTSGSMTPPPVGAHGSPSVSPTSGRSSSATAAAGPPDPSARIAGPAAYAWSRSAMISSLGDSGFSVFHAGHCDWQRPHSVQVAKSRMPFQEKSSTLPTPKLVSSSISSMSSSDRGTPDAVSGLAAPRAMGCRLNSTLMGAVMMCRCLECTTSIRNTSITPMCSSSPRPSRTCSVPSDSPSSIEPMALETNAPPLS